MERIRTSFGIQVALWCVCFAAACGGDENKGAGTGDVTVSTPGPGTTTTSGTAGGVSTGTGFGGSPAASGGAGRTGVTPPITPPQTPMTPMTPMTPGMTPGGTPMGTPPAAGAPARPPMTPMPPAMPGPVPWNTSGKTCLMAGSGKFGEPGPYKVAQKTVDLGMIQANQSSGQFTIFYPQTLESSCLHPIVAWGNGTTVTDAGTYAFFNSNAASWGMVVIAAHESNAGSGAHQKAGIDYLIKQNDDMSSPFFKKLAVTRVGTSGHSQGAGGAVAAARHPAVTVNVGVGGPAIADATHAGLCLTGTEDIASTSCPAFPDRARGPAFAASWQGGDHVKTETIAGYLTKDAGTMGMQRLYAAWFRCFLADDGVACDLFKGATPDACGLCKEKQMWAVLKSANIQ